MGCFLVHSKKKRYKSPFPKQRGRGMATHGPELHEETAWLVKENIVVWVWITMLVCFSKPHTSRLVCVKGYIFSWHYHEMREEKWSWWRSFRRQSCQAGDDWLSLRFNICKCDIAGYFQGELETISSRVCGNVTRCFKRDLRTLPAMFGETKSGTLSHNMMFSWT